MNEQRERENMPLFIAGTVVLFLAIIIVFGLAYWTRYL